MSAAVSGVPAEARIVGSVERNLQHIVDSEAGKRCLECAHVKHNELGYCQVGQCPCSSGVTLGNTARRVLHDLPKYVEAKSATEPPTLREQIAAEDRVAEYEAAGLPPSSYRAVIQQQIARAQTAERERDEARSAVDVAVAAERERIAAAIEADDWFDSTDIVHHVTDFREGIEYVTERHARIAMSATDGSDTDE